MNTKKLIILTIFFSIVGLFESLYAQLIRTDYGQNRIQYNQKEKWYRYESPNFAVSFAESQGALVEFVVPIAERGYFELKALLEYQVKKRMELVIYSDYSDYEQSNIGLVSPSVNTEGPPKLDNKILVYFNGNHQDLQNQIREGIARVLVNRMLLGSNLREIVQNAVLLHLPQWFTEGIIAYATEEWSTEKDNDLREVFLSGRYRNFLDFAKQEPRLAGHALFHFIGRKHGTTHVSNLLYLTRISRNMENDFLYVFGASFYTVVGGDWSSYFTERYKTDGANRRFPSEGELTLKKNKKIKIKHLKISPNGDYVAYTEHLRGKSRVVLHQVNEDKAEVIWRIGVKGHETNYNTEAPILAWAKNNRSIYLAYTKKDKAVIQQFSIKTKAIEKTYWITDVETITSLDVAGENTFLITAIARGQSDLYQYNTSSKTLTALTRDLWDDQSAIGVKLNGKRGVIFSSNREDKKLALKSNEEQLPLGNFDLYFYDLENRKAQLVQLTRTPHISEYAPSRLSDTSFTYLSGETGIVNRYIASIDSIVVNHEKVVELLDGTRIVVPKDSSLKDDFQADELKTTYLRPIRILGAVAYANTDYSRNLLEHHCAHQKNKIADLLYREGTYRVFVRKINPNRTMQVRETQYLGFLKKDYGLAETPAKDMEVENVRTSNQTKNDAPLSKEDADQLIAKELDLLESEMSSAALGDTTKPSHKESNLPDTAKLDIDNYQFQNEFEEIKQPKANSNAANNSQDIPQPDDIGPRILIDDGNGNIASLPPRVRKSKNKRRNLNNAIFKAVDYEEEGKKIYRNLFKVDEIAFQLDNSILFNGYDIFLGTNYRYPAIGLLFKTQFTDVFENYRLEMGVRLPINFNGMEYFVIFENRKKRVDQKYSLYRRGRLDDLLLTDTVSNTSYIMRTRNIKHLVQAEFKYPLNRYHSVRVTPSLQVDRIAVLAEEQISIEIPVYNEARLGLRLEYVFDNSISLRVNIKKGIRYKVFTEFFKPFSVEMVDQFRVNFSGGLTSALGFDLRHYLSLADRGVLALRVSGATSLGQQKILYALGGTENWMFPSYNPNIALPSDRETYAYQVAVSNVRGFRNNIRNGNSYAVINAELRIPIMEHISRKPPRNLFLRSLQIVTFYDVGTAWRGVNPFDPNNPLNTTIINTGTDPNSYSPVRVRVKYYRKPIVMGWGLGLRAALLGSYLRLDYAWGIETGILQTPRLHLSLATDF